MSNAYLHAKCRFDTAENEPVKILQKSLAGMMLSAGAQEPAEVPGAAGPAPEGEAGEATEELLREIRMVLLRRGTVPTAVH